MNIAKPARPEQKHKEETHMKRMIALLTALLLLAAIPAMAEEQVLLKP